MSDSLNLVIPIAARNLRPPTAEKDEIPRYVRNDKTAE